MPSTGDLRRPTEIPLDAIARFWDLIDRSGGPDACWPWLGARSNGYGIFTIDSHNRFAHRVAYRLFVGAIAHGALVCHRCDNPPCVNPTHLFSGDSSANVQDMVAKDRQPAHMRPHARCRQGHELVGDNVLVWAEGRRCRTCRNARDRAARSLRSGLPAPA